MDYCLTRPDKQSVLSECKEILKLIGKEMSFLRLMILCKHCGLSCEIDGEEYDDNILSLSLDIHKIDCIKFFEYGRYLEDIRAYMENGEVKDVVFNVGFDGEVFITDASIDDIETNFETYLELI